MRKVEISSDDAGFYIAMLMGALASFMVMFLFGWSYLIPATVFSVPMVIVMSLKELKVVNIPSVLLALVCPFSIAFVTIYGLVNSDEI